MDIIKALLHEHDHPQVNPDEDPFAVSKEETVEIKKDWTRPGLWPMVKQDHWYKQLISGLMRTFKVEEDWLVWAGMFNEWGPKNVCGAVKYLRGKQEAPWPNKVLEALQNQKRIKEEEREKQEAVRRLDV